MSAALPLRVEALHCALGDRPVLRGASLTVPRHALHFVLGASGSGKSVLLEHVVGLRAVAAGHIWVEGVALDGAAPWAALRRQVQLVPQGPSLFDHLTVLDNVALPLRRALGLPAAAARQRAVAALEAVQAADLAPRWPATLGPGVLKRLAVARALALRPTLLLYDEPTTGLDPVAARRMDALLARLHAGAALTQVVVSHDLQSVRAAARTVSFLHAGQVVFDGDVDAFFAADHPAVVAFRAPPAFG